MGRRRLCFAQSSAAPPWCRSAGATPRRPVTDRPAGADAATVRARDRAADGSARPGAATAPPSPPPGATTPTDRRARSSSPRSHGRTSRRRRRAPLRRRVRRFAPPPIRAIRPSRRRVPPRPHTPHRPAWTRAERHLRHPRHRRPPSPGRCQGSGRQRRALPVRQPCHRCAALAPRASAVSLGGRGAPRSRAMPQPRASGSTRRAALPTRGRRPSIDARRLRSARTRGPTRRPVQHRARAGPRPGRAVTATRRRVRATSPDEALRGAPHPGCSRQRPERPRGRRNDRPLVTPRQRRYRRRRQPMPRGPRRRRPEPSSSARRSASGSARHDRRCR